MILLELFWGFLKVGLFSFGGAYAAIPLIREVVLSYGWLDDSAVSYMIAVSESTPGPIMVNLATYVGSSQGGSPGAAVATLAVSLPAFVIILLVMAVLKHFLERPRVQAVLHALEAAVAGVILAVGGWMLVENLTGSGQGSGGAAASAEAAAARITVDWRAVGITLVLAALLLGAKPLLHKKLSPIALICAAAVLGAIVYGL